MGAGRMGVSLAAELARGGPFRRVRLAGRSPEPPRVLRAMSGVRYLALPDGWGPAPAALAAAAPDCVLFCVPDDALAEAGARWAAALAEAGVRLRVALHTSGFHPAEALAPLRGVGAAVGSWHPLVAVAEPRLGAFRGIAVGIEGDPAAAGLGEEIARALGARPLRVRAGEKARYHAAAVFASNHLLACLAVALRELGSSVEGEVALEDLLPLARSALDAAEEAGLAKGATGPLVRGDVRTVAGHLRSLDPGAASLYRALAAELLRQVEPRLPGEARRALRELLASAGRRAGAEPADAESAAEEPLGG